MPYSRSVMPFSILHGIFHGILYGILLCILYGILFSDVRRVSHRWETIEHTILAQFMAASLENSGKLTNSDPSGLSEMARMITKGVWFR